MTKQQGEQIRQDNLQDSRAVKFDCVSKIYTLYSSERQRFFSLFHKSKSIKTHQALHDVSFEIKRGEAVGFIGSNGAGKSTLLKLATGVAFPTSGEVEINGNIAALLELKAGFASDLTGRENIYLKGYILGCTKEEIATMESDIIEFAELGEYIDQPLRTYSSGMKVRLGFAVNVNTNPDILIVDEALSVGDKYFKAKCNNKIRSLVDSGVTVLFVSHSMNAVKEICERVIYLKKGRIVFDGPSKEAIAIYGKSKK